MKLTSYTLVVSLTLLPAAVTGNLLRPVARAVSTAPPDYDGCLPFNDFTLEVDAIENEEETITCKNAFFAALQDYMESEGTNCSTRGNPAAKELLKLTGHTGGASSLINTLCANAIDNQEPHEEYGNFHDIAEASDRPLDMKEYYDGGTFLNAEIGSFEGDEEAQFILDVNDTLRESLIEFPSDIYNFDKCKLNSAMCCFVQDRHDDNNAGDGNCELPDNCVDKDPADNTDICYVDIANSPKSSHVKGGFAVFHALFDEDDEDVQTEGRAHCHGLAWKDKGSSPSKRYRGNLLFYVSLYDHLHQRGYVRNVPGAPMCGCQEKMPVVSESDCTEMAVTETYTFTFNATTRSLEAEITEVDITFNACTGIAGGENNDLRDFYARLDDNGEVNEGQFEDFKDLVVDESNCDEAISAFMEGHGWVREEELL